MITRIAAGHRNEAGKPDFIRAVAAEFIFTFHLVFVSVGSSMAAGKLAGGGGMMGMTAMALANALVVAVLVSAGMHISGSHFNPAVTIGLAIGGYITLFRSVLYILVQLLGSVLACFLLKFLTGGLETPIHRVAEGMGVLQGVIMEMILTFFLVFSVYATIMDPNRSTPDGLGPLLIGLLICPISLAGGAFSGASMNPARSFGPALISCNWTHHWVYWVGPIVGSVFAVLIYENFFIVDNHNHISLKKKANALDAE